MSAATLLFTGDQQIDIGLRYMERDDVGAVRFSIIAVQSMPCFPAALARENDQVPMVSQFCSRASPDILMQSYFLSLHVIREPTFSIKQLHSFSCVVNTTLIASSSGRFVENY